MLNPRIIYIAVVTVFIFILVRSRLIPYLAAKKILKDSKKNGTHQTSAQPPDQNAPALSPSFMTAAMQALLSQGTVPGSSPVPSPASSRPGHRDMYFDYTVIRTDDGSLPDVEAVCRQTDTAVNQYLSDLRDHGIFPDTLGLVCLDGGLLLAYVTYTR